jgi:hypothetical protein
MDDALDLLTRLGIAERNPGACLGPEWLPASIFRPSTPPPVK